MKLNKQRKIDADVYTLAKNRIHNAFELFDHVVVSFSGGKDSTCVLNVALEVARERGRLPLHVVFFDDEVIPFQTVEYVERVRQEKDIKLDWYCLPVRYQNACSRKTPWHFTWAPERRDVWVREQPEFAITHVPGFPVNPPEDRVTFANTFPYIFNPSEYGTVGVLVGIRTQESVSRLRAILGRGDNPEPYITNWKGAEAYLNRVYPIYDWTKDDVWTAPKLKGWDYNRAYDIMEMHGISHHDQRCASPFGYEGLHLFKTFKTCFPELWAKMLKREDGVNTAGLYGDTELFGISRQKLQCPPGMTWPEALKHYIEKWAPVEKEIIAKRIKTEIKRHYKKTTDPIAGEAFHPWTGLSWEWLLRICMRGDLKKRRFAEKNLPTLTEDPTREKYIKAYVDEIRSTEGDQVADNLECVKEGIPV